MEIVIWHYITQFTALMMRQMNLQHHWLNQERKMNGNHS